jgi:hypothetical protein
MRLLALVFCGLLLQIGCFGQRDLSVTNDGFSSFISSLTVKKTSDFKTVRKLFNKAHKDYLKNYVAYSQVNDIFERGDYDCLSGTYFFARVLDELGISYKIVETNYHIFLTVQTDRGEVLMETTDCVNGLVRNQRAIDERILKYQQTRSNESGSELYLSRIRIFHELHLSQLPGLLYFNRAVEAFNKKDLNNCCLYLDQARKIYDNQRIEIFTPILLHSLEVSQLDKDTKEKLMSLIQAHQQSGLHAIASR